MTKEELQKIVDELSAERNKSLTSLSDNELVDIFFRIHINIFTSTFFPASVELLDEIKDLNSAYMVYFRLRTNAVRYLLELYLTFAHIANLSQADRFVRVHVMSIKEKIDLHQTDLEIHKLSPTEATLDKLNNNGKEYIEFLSLHGNLDNKLPSSIGDFFENGTSVKKSLKQFGVGSDIKYTEEIKNNSKISEDTKIQLFSMYSLLSLYAHPKLSTIVKFEKFIGFTEEQKRTEIQKGRDEVGAFLKFISQHMLILTKEVLVEKQNEYEAKK